MVKLIKFSEQKNVIRFHKYQSYSVTGGGLVVVVVVVGVGGVKSSNPLTGVLNLQH